MNKKRFSDFLALQKHTVALILMVILVGTGERIAERYLPLYLVALGGGMISIGIFSGAGNLINAIYSFFGGIISDRIGHKQALLLFNAMTIVGYIIVILFPYWQAVIIGSFFFLSWSAVSMPATLDLVAKSVPSNKRTMGVSINSLTRRVPMMVGPLIGGILVGKYGEERGITYAFAVAIVLAVVSLIVQQQMISPGERRSGPAEMHPRTLWRTMPPPLKNLLFSDILIRFCEQIPYAFVVIWCVNIVGISTVEFGILTTVEMATALLIYIPVAYFSDAMIKKPFVAATFVFFTLFPPALLHADSFWLLTAAFVLRGLKEFGEPTRKAMILDLSPEGQKAGMFGFYYLLRDSVVSVAALIGAWLWLISPETNLYAAFAFGAAGTVLFILKGK